MAHKKVNAKSRPSAQQKKSWQNVIVINFVLTVIGALFLNYYTKRPEIEWIYRMLASNHAVIRENPDATLDQRLASKLRYSYVYLAYVRDNTPDSAVILFPRRDVIFRQPTQFTDSEFSIPWISSFIYPRKAVIDDGQATPEHVTHIAVMNSWGYDRLNYSVASPPENCVLPVEKNFEGKR